MRKMFAMVVLATAVGYLKAGVESPVVSIDRPLPSELLALARRPAEPAEQPAERGGLKDCKLSEADNASLWKALSKARREISDASGSEDGALLKAHNPGQKISARFLPGEVTIAPSRTNASWLAAFALEGVTEKPAAVTSRGTRMEYDRGSLVEWYENRSEGLEHGVILKERPAHAGPEIRLCVAINGLRPRLCCTEDAVELLDAQGNPILNYAKLKAWDADGKILTSRMEVEQGRIALVVSDATARYPVTIDPLITSQQAKLGPEVTGSGAMDDRFGWSVALSGDTALVGAYLVDGLDASGGIAVDQGSTYVFTLTRVMAVTLDYCYDNLTEPLLVPSNGTYDSLPAVTRPVHSFLGWYRTPTNTVEDSLNHVDNRIYSTNLVETALTTLYARWSSYTATQTTPLSIPVSALAPHYPGDISQKTPEEIEAYANGNAANALYKVWELILLDLDPDDAGLTPTKILAYITRNESGQLLVHKIPAAGLPGLTTYKQWGKQNLADPSWSDLGVQGTAVEAATGYRFFKVTGE